MRRFPYLIIYLSRHGHSVIASLNFCCGIHQDTQPAGKTQADKYVTITVRKIFIAAIEKYNTIDKKGRLKEAVRPITTFEDLVSGKKALAMQLLGKKNELKL